METNSYLIRVTTLDTIYVDYLVDAANVFFAKIKARNMFLKEYPDANPNVKLSLLKPDTIKIKEALNIIKEAN